MPEGGADFQGWQESNISELGPPLLQYCKVCSFAFKEIGDLEGINKYIITLVQLHSSDSEQSEGSHSLDSAFTG